MDLTPLMPWLVAASTILSLGTAVFTLLTSGAKQNARDLVDTKKSLTDICGTLEKLIDEHDRRIQKLENDFGHLPDKEIVHRLELTMKDMQVQMAGMAASSEATARTARRVEEFLLDQAKSA